MKDFQDGLMYRLPKHHSSEASKQNRNNFRICWPQLLMGPRLDFYNCLTTTFSAATSNLKKNLVGNQVGRYPLNSLPPTFSFPILLELSRKESDYPSKHYTQTLHSQSGVHKKTWVREPRTRPSLTGPTVILVWLFVLCSEPMLFNNVFNNMYVIMYFFIK